MVDNNNWYIDTTTDTIFLYMNIDEILIGFGFFDARKIYAQRMVRNKYNYMSINRDIFNIV